MLWAQNGVFSSLLEHRAEVKRGSRESKRFAIAKAAAKEASVTTPADVLSKVRALVEPTTGDSAVIIRTARDGRQSRRRLCGGRQIREVTKRLTDVHRASVPPEYELTNVCLIECHPDFL